MIKVEGLSVNLGEKEVLHEISFSVEEGEFIGIIGPNGSGKSTLLQTLTQWNKLSAGAISLLEKPLNSYSMKERASLVALLSQHMDHSLGQTVRETIQLGRYAHKRGIFQQWTEEDESRVNEAISWLKLQDYTGRAASDLSGGERQRVAFAQTIVQNPKVLLLDEPINHLDVRYQKELLDYVTTWVKESSRSVITVFHDINMAALYCDRLLVLQDGKLVANGKPEAILQQSLIEEVFETKPFILPHATLPKSQVMWTPSSSSSNEETSLDTTSIKVTETMIHYHTKRKLRTISSGITGAGIGWHSHFVNRHVTPYYDSEQPKEEMEQFLQAHGIPFYDAVSMMTAVELKDVAVKKVEEPYPMLLVATAGLGDAIDPVTRPYCKEMQNPGTINLWIFVHATLPDEALLQACMTVTEAKVKALHDLGVKDFETNTIATGTATDSLVIGATQTGPRLPFAGTGTEIGSLLAKQTYEIIGKAVGNRG